MLPSKVSAFKVIIKISGVNESIISIFKIKLMDNCNISNYCFVLKSAQPSIKWEIKAGSQEMGGKSSICYRNAPVWWLAMPIILKISKFSFMAFSLFLCSHKLKCLQQSMPMEMHVHFQHKYSIYEGQEKGCQNSCI